jgi:hypothetical protein
MAHPDERVQCHGIWTEEEHTRYLQARRIYPAGPWNLIAEIVKTRTPRQIRNHERKLREKKHRHQKKLSELQSFEPIALSDLNLYNPLPLPMSVNAANEDVAKTGSMPCLSTCLDFFIELFDDTTTAESAHVDLDIICDLFFE